MESKFDTGLGEHLYYIYSSKLQSSNVRKEVYQIPKCAVKQLKLQPSDTYNELLMNKQQCKDYWQKLFGEEFSTNPKNKM